jgi:sulfur-oxidizing protein SoxA
MAWLGTAAGDRPPHLVRQRRLSMPEAMGGTEPTTSRLIALLAIAVVHVASPVFAQQSRPEPAMSGQAFQSAETRRLEADEAQNPAMLWIEEGARLWARPEGSSGRSCESCHGPSASALKGSAAHHPRFDRTAGILINIEGQINRCRQINQAASPYSYESDELLALTTLVAHQSRGIPRKVDITGPAKQYFETGRTFWQTRQGQLNLACTQCHDSNSGRMLRGDRVSQGQSDGWPAYRLEWQSLGSLHRRLRACSLGVRAEVLDYGAPEYLALELYLAWRGEGLPYSAPGVRR